MLTISIITAKISNAQTTNDTLPASKTRITDNRPLKKVFIKKDSAEISGGFKINTKTIYYYGEDNFENKQINRHEWNHYKNYMFGAHTFRNKIEDSFLLGVIDELICCIAGSDVIASLNDSFLTHTDKKWLLIRRMDEFAYFIMNDDVYKSDFRKHATFFCTKSKNIENMKTSYISDESVDYIIKDMLVLYIDNNTIDLNKYLNESDISRINKIILSDKSSRNFFIEYAKMVNPVKDTSTTNMIAKKRVFQKQR